MYIEEPESNDNDVSNKSSTTKENDIKSRLRKHPNKTKVLYINELPNKKAKKNSGISFNQLWKDTCREIIETLKKDEKSFLFRQPAIKSFSDPKDRKIYKDQIKEPRDLSTISKKLKTENYSPKEFYDDLELCWSNALAFNDKSTEAYQYALYLKDLAAKLYKEKGLEELIDRYDNENISSHNNTTNYGTNSDDKINLNENMGTDNKEGNDNSNNNKINKESEQVDSIGTNSSEKSNKDDESYEGSDLKKNKVTGRKRGRPKLKEENIIQETEDKKKGKKKKKQNDENININNNKIIKKINNLDDIKKIFPINNYPVLTTPDDLSLLVKNKNKAKNKIKKITKNTNNNNIKKGKNNINNNTIIEKKITCKYEWELLDNTKYNKISDEQKEDGTLRKELENNLMSKFDINCSYDNNMNSTNKNMNNEQDNNLKKNKNEINKANNDNNKINKNNNINDIKNKNNINNAIKIVNDKNNELRLQIAKYFDHLNDNSMIKTLVYIENIRPQSIRILENDTIYIDMEAFTDDTYKCVFDFMNNLF